MTDNAQIGAALMAALRAVYKDHDGHEHRRLFVAIDPDGYATVDIRRDVGGEGRRNDATKHLQIMIKEADG